MGALIALAYLLSVAAGLTALAVALRPRPIPPPRTPGTARPAQAEEADIRAFLTAAARLAARQSPTT